MNRSANKSMGRFGESVTAEYLTREGYEILERNYRSDGGEIDIIAKRGVRLAFVEVKLRSVSAAGYARGSAAVTYAKQQRIIKTALNYIRALRAAGQTYGDFNPCFDVAELVYEEFDSERGEKLCAVKINYITSAFGVRGYGEHYGDGYRRYGSQYGYGGSRYPDNDTDN